MVHRSKKGFTLIELLVVIAIIAILAAILFPVFAQARESARSSSCLSNTKQIGLAILQYVQDYDEFFPPAMYEVYTTDPAYNKPDLPWGPWKNRHTGWDKLVQPYIKNTQVFKCPSATPGPDAQNAGADSSARTGAIQYYMNKQLTGDPIQQVSGWVSGFKAQKLASCNFAAATILAADDVTGASTGSISHEFDGWGWADGHAHLINGDNYQGDPWTDGDMQKLCTTGNRLDHSTWSGVAALRRHKDGGNYVFVDGHAKWYKADATCVVWDRSKWLTGQTITYKKGGGWDF